MATEAEIQAALDALNNLLAGPKRVRGDGGIEVETHSASDLIAIHKYLASQGAAGGNKPRRGLYFTKLLPPGTD